jgi:phage terminase small subunit
MRTKLTIKQENFCQAYIETGNASEAFRRAYDISRMKRTSIHRCALNVLNNSQVSARVEMLRAESARRHNVTIDMISERLENIYQMAIQGDNPKLAVAVAAVLGLAKLHGLLIDKVDVRSIDVSAILAQARKRVEP